MKAIMNVPDLKELNLKPRDIRNYIGKIADDNFKDIVMWHDRKYPPLIYPKPFKGGFEVISYGENMDFMNFIKEKIYSHTDFFGKKIKGVRLKDEKYGFPLKESRMYETRTPIIIAVNEFEMSGACNDIYFKNYINMRINRDVEYQIKSIFDVRTKLNIEIMPIEIKRLSIEYKPGIKFPAVAMKFYSNYALPRFLGYKNGLGWGEIIPVKFN